MIKTLDDIAEELKMLKFRKQLIGGVDEADVWRKLQKLHEDYSNIIDYNEGKYKALLVEKEAKIRELEVGLSEFNAGRGEP